MMSKETERQSHRKVFFHKKNEYFVSLVTILYSINLHLISENVTINQ